MRSARPEKTYRLVVADDEEGLLFLMTEGLRREGYEVEGFENGQSALEWLGKNSADLLLVDLKLADIPGPVLVERLRERGREFPFIVVTGHGDERTAVEVMKQGALDYVMKESGMLDLLPGIVRRALGVIERDRQLAAANEAVRKREEMHQKIIQTALDGFVRFGSNLEVLEMNHALCELLGVVRCETPDDLTTVANLLLTEDVRAQISDMCGKHFAHFFTRLKRADGALLDVEISMRADGHEYFAFVHDLSEQRRLEREVLQSSYDERNRIGRELHDGVGQQLTAIEMMCHALARRLKEACPRLAKPANEIAHYTRLAIGHTRELAHGLAPVTLEAEGLMAALGELARMTSAAGVECEFDCPAPVLIHDLATATHMHRIAQEAVNNALKHGKPTRIDLRLRDAGPSIELAIEDNGRGMPAGNARKKAGMGLQLIRHRARLIGANLDIQSQRGQGVRVVCVLPNP